MKRKEHKKKRNLRCINGVKGAISLFMAVLMTPFLTIAFLLVEAGRYNSAVSLLDEALGVTSLSTLANYDDYLQERWGLLALSQDMDINSVYSQSLDTNVGVMGSAISIDKVSASGMYALSEEEILQYQLLEYCKLNAPTKIGTEIVSKVTSLLDIVEKLEKTLKSWGNIVDLATKGVSTLDSGITMVKSAEELEKSANALDALKTEYDSNYTAFEKAVNTLIDNLKKKKTLEEERQPLLDELALLQKELKELEEKKADEETKDEVSDEDIEAKKKEISEKKDEIKPYDEEISKLNTTISKNRQTANTAKSNYSTTIFNISTELTNFREHMGKCQEAVSQIQQNVAGAVTDVAKIAVDLEKKKTDLAEKEKDLKALKESVENWDGAKDDPAYIAGVEMQVALQEEVSNLQAEIGDMQTTVSVSDAMSDGVGKLADELGKSTKAYDDATIGKIIDGFNALKRTVDGLNISSVSASTKKVTKGVYKAVAVSGYIKAGEIQKYLDAQEKELQEGSLKALLEGFKAMYEQLMRLTIFFDPSLSSNIDVEYYNNNFGGLPGGASSENPVLGILNNISNICKSGISMVGNLAKLKLLKILEDLKSIVENVKSLFENIGKLIENFLVNIAELVDYRKYYITAYCTYNLACRTDFKNGSTSLSTMTGYGVGEKSFDEASPMSNVPIFGNLLALVDTIKTGIEGTGDDIMFTGAELEYLMFGSISEVANQLYVFAVMYLIRLVSSLPAIMADTEVQSLAASATLGYPVVLALYILLEPLVQTVLLVNGKEQAFIPTEVYLSPSGLPKLASELIFFCNLTDKQAEELNGKMVDAVAKSKDDYDYQTKLHEYKNVTQKVKLSIDFGYKDYCLIVTLLTVTKEQQVARLANLIQMETLCYYNNMKAEYTFDLNKSYTYLNVHVDGSVKQMLPTLADSALFKVSRDHFRGY